MIPQSEPTAMAGVTGVILAGGRASRLGGVDKGMLRVAGKPLIEHALAALVPQVARVLISANRNLEHYAAYGWPVVSDTLDGYAGPLAGVLSALRAARDGYILTVPCDCPLPPSDLAARLREKIAQRNVCVAHDGTRMQPLFALLSRTLTENLQDYLDGGGRKVETWITAQRPVLVDFSDQPWSFLNVNTPRERATLECRMLHTPFQECF